MEEKKKMSGWKIFGIICLVLIGIGFFGELFKNNSSNSLTGNDIKTDEKITILDNQLTYEEYGNQIIAGTAKNIAGKELSYCEIDAKFYDNSGAVIGTSLTNINNLGKDETWKFKIYPLITGSEIIDHYLINVGSCW